MGVTGLKEAAESLILASLGVPTKAKAQSLQDKAFSAGLKTRSPGTEVRGWHIFFRIP